jgi:hypothetical protein
VGGPEFAEATGGGPDRCPFALVDLATKHLDRQSLQQGSDGRIAAVVHDQDPRMHLQASRDDLSEPAGLIVDGDDDGNLLHEMLHLTLGP